MAVYSTLAAVDLGSNSFHLQVARVVGDQIYPLDSLREPIRFGAGLNREKRLDEDSQNRALDCMKRFGERLRGFDPHGVRAVGTNTLRVAKNAGRVSETGRSRARLSDRGGGRARGSAPDLCGRGAQPAGVQGQAPGGRHRRRLDRIHHRPRLEAAAAGQPVHGLRQLQPQILSRRQSHQERDEAGRARRAQRAANHGCGFRQGQVAAGGGFVGQRARAGRNPAVERLFRSRDYARTASTGCARP